MSLDNDLLKVERVNADDVTLYVLPNWYRIPNETLITIPCVVTRYGLTPTAEDVYRWLPELDPFRMTVDTTSSDYYIVRDDLLSQLKRKWEGIQTDPIADLKRLIAKFPNEWTTALNQNILS